MEATTEAEERPFPIGFTQAAEARVLAWLKENVRLRYRDLIGFNPEPWLREVFESVSDRVPGKHEPEYELKAHESVSGNPELLGFADTDFVWSNEE